MNNFDINSVLKQLNNELSAIDEKLEIICADGFVMQYYGYRATLDIDAFYTGNDNIEKTIKKVGDI